MSELQHPDLVEKRRKAFGDNLRAYLAASQQKGGGAQSPEAPSDGSLEGAHPGDQQGAAQANGPNLRRRAGLN